MYVPNYVPEPLEVPNNVTLERYARRMVFVRRVVFAHVASLLAVAGLSRVVPAMGELWQAGVLLLALLIGLAVLRVAVRGRILEAQASALAMPLLLVVVAVAAQHAAAAGFPSWAFLPGPLALGLYTVACGRDFSFVGAYALALTGSSIGIAIAVDRSGLPASTAVVAHATNVVYLAFVVYDLASLMARRRFNEVPAAVVDLYRDVLNVFGYVPRVIQHWRKHKIWTDVIPKEWGEG